MATVYSVGQINAYIKNMFSQDFLLTKLSVQGEASNVKYHSSGHVYFTLKDEQAAIGAILFASQRPKLRFRLEDGMRVIVSGRIGVYEQNGTFRLYAQEIRQEGRGILYERFEALKESLQEMGMFAPEYKQSLPTYVRTLGIVTAPTGAAVRDMIQISRRRNPGIRILLYPAKVQGEGAAASVAEGIRQLDAAGVDVIIIGRGGGSIEDLWAFNEEVVARAVFACRTPIISAVGHETDTVISDYVADLRAPTPSAAAELAVADMAQVVSRLTQDEELLRRGMQRALEAERARVTQLMLRLALHSPQGKLTQATANCSALAQRLQTGMDQALFRSRSRLERSAQMLAARSPAARLSSGYAYVSDRTGRRISTVAQARQAQRLTIWMQDGSVDVRIDTQEGEGES